MSAERIHSHRKQVNQLKTQFERLQQEIITKLKECGNCIESAARLNQEADVLVKNLEESLVNVSNEAKEWQQIKVKLASTVVKGKVILDVGGDKYSTSVDTLTREKNTYFTAMFSRQWELERDPKDDSIFIDRDGKLFVHILAYLRTDSVPSDIMTNESLRQKLILEAKYFHLHHLLEILMEPERKEAERKEVKRKEAERINAFFNGGSLLSEDQRKILIGFLDNTLQKTELIYKASRDGFDANAFHSRCDNKGPTLTIVRSNNNYLFGGYTSVAWTSSGNWTVDSKAFLFTLTNPNNIPPTKYPVQSSKTQNAVAHNSGYGPMFGSDDLWLYANSNSNNSSCTAFPAAYTDTTRYGNNTFTGNRNFMTSDIEVFKLT
jgi:hypothetical protein